MLLRDGSDTISSAIQRLQSIGHRYTRRNVGKGLRRFFRPDAVSIKLQEFNITLLLRDGRGAESRCTQAPDSSRERELQANENRIVNDGGLHALARELSLPVILHVRHEDQFGVLLADSAGSINGKVRFRDTLFTWRHGEVRTSDTDTFSMEKAAKVVFEKAHQWTDKLCEPLIDLELNLRNRRDVTRIAVGDMFSEYNFETRSFLGYGWTLEKRPDLFGDISSLATR